MSVEKIDFLKVTKESTPFSVILNSVSQNIPDLETIGLWVYLYSLPPDWKICKKQLKKKFNIGDDKLKLIFSYLKRSNLIQYFRERNEQGQIKESRIHILCGLNFIKETPFKKTTGVKTTPIELSTENGKNTTGGLTTRVANHTCGPRALQIKQDTNKNLLTKKTKSFYKEQNETKHDFADSMNQMAREKKHIEEHEKIKKMPIPEDIRESFVNIGILKKIK